MRIVTVLIVALGAVAGYQFGPGACLGGIAAVFLLGAIRPQDVGNEDVVPDGSFPHACPGCRQILLFHRHDDGAPCIRHWGRPCEWYRKPETTAEVVASSIDRPGERGSLDGRGSAN